MSERIIRGMSGYKVVTKETKRPRRILAVICVVCMVVLQCMVVLPAATGESYAAGKLELTGNISGFEPYDASYTGDDATVKKILKDKGVSTDSIDSLSAEYDITLDTEIVRRDGKYGIIEIVPGPDDEEGNPTEEEIFNQITFIDFTMKSSYNPVSSISIDSIGDLKSGESKTIKYKVKGDSFFKKNNFDDFVQDPIVEGASNVSFDSEHITFTAGETGSKIKVTVSGEIGGNPSATQECTVVTKTLTVKPSSIYIKVGDSTKLAAYNDQGKKITSGLKWESSSSKIASVSSKGKVTGKKKGNTTIKVKDEKSGLTAKVSVTVSEKATTSSYSNRTYSRITNRTGSAITRSSSSGTGLTTATRPNMTSSTLAPSFQTMQVKEVYLTPVNQQETQYYDEYGNPIEDEEDEWGDEGEEEDWDEDGVTLPQAAGSAAVAAAACGAGAVGRIRRFKFDMSSAAASVVSGIAAGGRRGKKNADAQSKETAQTREAKSDSAGEKSGSRNPLKKFRRK